MSFALVVIALLIIVPFVLLVVDLGRRGGSSADRSVGAAGTPRDRTGQGQGMVHRPRS